jgi:hypothetical protein
MDSKTDIIKLHADYDCFPLWRIGPQTVENIDPQRLPISQELKRMIYVWQQQYDETLNRDDPPSSGFTSHEHLIDFDADGWEIWRRLSQELEGLYRIQYYSEADAKLFE